MHKDFHALKSYDFSYFRFWATEMTIDYNDGQQHSLKRLPLEAYRGHAYVHWSMTMDDRKTGWLTPVFYYRFREILTHAMFRYAIGSPIFTCMPDHIHLLLAGIQEDSDQRIAIKFLRTQLNRVLKEYRTRLQQQAYDHILRDAEREQTGFETVVDYIARNPERAGLVRPDGFRDYPYSGCLILGYPDLNPFQSDYWELFPSIYSSLRRDGMVRTMK